MPAEMSCYIQSRKGVYGSLFTAEVQSREYLTGKVKLVSRTAAEEILSSVGLKKTPGRLALVRLLLEAEGPLTHQEITQRMESFELNPVSIYRSLDAFVHAGIVHRVDTGERIGRFALCVCGSHEEGHGHSHPHFTCKSCGKTECLEDQVMPALAVARPGYTVHEVELYLWGICASCAVK